MMAGYAIRQPCLKKSKKKFCKKHFVCNAGADAHISPFYKYQLTGVDVGIGPSDLNYFV